MTLADSVVIGPNCFIRGEVAIGEGSRLVANCCLNGPLRLGAGNTLYPNVCLGFAPQDRKYPPGRAGAGVVIGDHNVFHDGFTLHRATADAPTRVGDHNRFLANSHIGHDCVIGDRCTLNNGALVGGHVEVADEVVLSGHAVVHQFCRLGRLSMMMALEGITKDLPPFCLVTVKRSVSGLNAVGLRRAGLGAHLPALRRAFDILYRQRLANTAAAQRIAQELPGDPLVGELVHFVRTATRGVLPYVSARQTGKGAAKNRKARKTG